MLIDIDLMDRLRHGDMKRQGAVWSTDTLGQHFRIVDANYISSYPNYLHALS